MGYSLQQLEYKQKIRRCALMVLRLVKQGMCMDKAIECVRGVYLISHKELCKEVNNIKNG